MNEESILTAVKKLLGITEECEDFDADIIMHINSVFTILHQLGVGPTQGFAITSKEDTWNQFTGNNVLLSPVRSYVFFKVKLMFDPPQSSSVMECYKANISELEFRLNVIAETEETSSDEAETYTGSYNVTPQAFSTQTLDTSGKVMSDDIVISEVPFYETENTSGGTTSYIAEGGK